MKSENATHPYFQKSLLSFLFLAVLLFPLTSNGETKSSLESAINSIWVWAEQAGEQHSIFLSRYDGENWEDALQVSDNTSFNVVPSITQQENGDIWVVWSAFSGQQAVLIYKRYTDGEWSAEETITTGLSSNTAPSIGIDEAGNVWLVWVGFDGANDEIYYSTWNGTSFDEGTPITQNDLPDILPVITIDSDQTISIQWQQFSTSGYVDYLSSWLGSEWSTPELVDTSADTTKETKNSSKQLELALPSFISNRASASIHIPGNSVQSYPARNMEIVQ